MSDLRDVILSQLSTGKQNAVTGKTLAERLGYKNDRAIRLAIRELIRQGHPVASSTEDPPGYYICETWQEMREYLATLKSRLIEDALRRRDFKQAAARRFQEARQPNLL